MEENVATKPRALNAKMLIQRCDPSQFDFVTTDDLKVLKEVIGQDRVMKSVQFGIGIQESGYNLFALGPTGIGKLPIIQKILENEAKKSKPDADWVYVNNFKEPQKPTSLKLPVGIAKKLKLDMGFLIDELKLSIPAILESEDFRHRMQELDNDYKGREDETLTRLQDDAAKDSLAILSTPNGFAVAPIKDNEALTTEEFQELPEEEREHKEKMIEKIRQELSDFLHQIPHWHKERRKKEFEILQEFTMRVVGEPIKQLLEKYSDITQVVAYLKEVELDIIKNAKEFRKQLGAVSPLGLPGADQDTFIRYQINILVEHHKKENIPVVFEDNPTYVNVLGRVEHLSQFGALTTDFTLIRPGALHRANGGYLVLDVRKVLMNPYCWDGLKRALASGHIVIETLGHALGLVSTVSLEPEPIELNVKVVLLGDPYLYYLLCVYDPEFNELFKVPVDFEEEINRSTENHYLYARLIASMVKEKKLMPFHRDAVARVIDHCARILGDSKKLTMHMRTLISLLDEANYYANLSLRKVVQPQDVVAAIEQKIYRSDRIKHVMYEQIQRETLFINTQGEYIGQINGLSVLELGEYRFGKPSRITATTRAGEGKVIDIDREVELSGHIHAKGVMILSGYLQEHYIPDKPFSLMATLVFEQSYGMVDGDSASVAELCAILSSLARVPINQSFAITGSINQHGNVQPIGGVNEKIEGFYDICKMQGLTGKQGVLIPQSNCQHLMLRDDVIEAVKNKQFSIYPIATIDEAISLLTGLKAGARSKIGKFPKDSIHSLVEERLLKFAKEHEVKLKKGDVGPSVKGNKKTSS